MSVESITREVEPRNPPFAAEISRILAARSARALLVIASVGAIVIGAISAVFLLAPGVTSPSLSGRVQAVEVSMFMLAMPLSVWAAARWAREYADGTVAISLLVTPRRGPLAAARLLSLPALALLLSLGVAAIVWGIGASFSALRGVDIEWSELSGIALGPVGVALTCVMAIGVGKVSRTPAVAMVVLLGGGVILPVALALGAFLAQGAPAALMRSALDVHPTSFFIAVLSLSGGDSARAVSAALGLIVWAAAIAAVAALTFLRRPCSVR